MNSPLDFLLGSRRPAPVPAPLPSKPHISAAVSLEISKAIRQLQFLDRAYGLRLWDTDQCRLDWIHDLELMRASGDMEKISLQLIDHAGQVCGEYSIAFQHGRRAATTKNDSGGIEMPVIDRHQVASKRVVVDRRGHSASYSSFLRMNWGPAARLAQATGDHYASEHAAKITGGRETGSFFVAASARHNMVITNASPKGAYCFARDTDMNVEGIFVMRQHAPDLPFQVGVRFTSLVAQTPKGLQARAARLAA